VAEKPVKAKQPEKNKKAEITKIQQPEKPRPFQVKAPVKEKKDEKERAQSKQPNRFVRWYKETLGELRKVSWPTLPEARRLTYIVLIVMVATAALLGSLDFVFSRVIAWLVTL
jgi:preprotein translocase subunit SecE